PAKGKAPWRYEERLLAFVVVKDRAPVCVPLGPAAPVARLIESWRALLTAARPAAPDEKAARELRRRLWLPLEKHLGGVDTVLISPAGALCGLPFAALPGGKASTFLLEERAIGYVPSGRHLLETATGGKRPEADGLLLVGGLAYRNVPQPPVGAPARG